MVDSDCRILWVSRAFERYFGVVDDDIVGHDLGRLLTSKVASEPPSGAVSRPFPSHGTAPAPECQVFECKILAGDGRDERWLESWSQPIRSGRHAGGRIDYYYDITSSKQVEEAVRRSENQLVQSQKMEAVGRLAGGLAHDFNNLLTAINGYTDLIMRSSDDPRVQTYVGEIKKAGDRAATLTSKLLSLSKPPPALRQVADLNRVVLHLEGLLQRLLGDDVELETRLPPDLTGVRMDPGQLEQVLLNLAVNARDAMPTGGHLCIEAANVEFGPEDVCGVCLSVTDTGVGIAPELLEHIFEPFFSTKEESKGSGLGLSTAYAAVTQSQGRIEVESVPGAGATFRIYLPAADAEAEESPERQQAATPPKRGNEQILLVEDDASVRKLVLELLGQQGYQVTAAEHAAHALEVVEGLDHEIDFLVTDVVMPGMSGPDLAERLTRRFPKLKVLFISGYTDSLVVRHGLLDAEHVMLQKPFDGSMLAVKIRELLDRSSSREGKPEGR